MTFFKWKPKLAFLVVTVLLVCLMSLVSFAQGNAVITVSDATGYTGDTVDVNVNMTNAMGMETGQISIAFDDTKLKIVSVVRGPLTQAADFYMDTFGAAGIETSPLNAQWYWNTASCQVDEGALITISFELIGEGTSDLILSLDPDDFSSVDLAATHNNGSITVKSYQLAQVEKPTWSDNTINWIGVENASAGYHVRLYKDGTKVWDGNANASASSLNLGTHMSNYGPGSFTATVMALAGTPYINGPESDHSDPKTYAVTLGKVAQPSWGTDWTITWSDLATGSPNYGNYVDHYNVNLVRAGGATKTVAVNPGEGKYAFVSGDFDGPGSYSVTVQAIGDGTLALDGALSTASAAKVRKEQLAQVAQPTWDSTPGIINWTSVEHAGSYKVELLKGGAVVETETTATLSQNFLAQMRAAEGTYTVRVTALAPAGSDYEDGVVSPSSAAQEVSKLGAPAKPAFSDQGVATWSPVTGASAYMVHLYKGTTNVDGYTISPSDPLEYDFMTLIRDEGEGTYTVRVVAIGTGYNLESDESAASDPRAASAMPAPAGLAWSTADPVLTWGNVAGATGYLVQLYKGGTAQGAPVNAANGTTGYDFTTAIGDAAGYYTAKVSAVGDGYFVLNSPDSLESPVFTKTGPLGQVTDLALSDRGVLTWVDEPDAVAFELQLYRVGTGVDTAIGDPRNIAAGVQSSDFRTAMRTEGAGEYYVTVTAVAEAGSLFANGAPLKSNNRAVSKLGDPANVGFSDKGVASWDAVDNATQYEVVLTLPAGHPEGTTESGSTDGLTMNYLSLMRQYPGVYRVTVVAQDTVGLYLDSNEVDSNTQTVEKLGQVSKPELTSDGDAEWKDITGPSGYLVSLFKGSDLVATATAGSGLESWSFIDAIKAAGVGSYTVTVKALGDEYLILDGEPSEASDPITAQELPGMNPPRWVIEDGVITLFWDEVEGAAGYMVTIYNGSGDEPVSQFVEALSLILPSEESGFFWATVQALGEGVVLDGTVSGCSHILVIFDPEMLDEAYEAEGTLPVPNLWMRITSATGQTGVMQIAGAATSAYAAPSGLTAAGIFFNIEFDENLSGAHALLRAGYDPSALPKGLNASSLRFYRYDAEKGWVLLESSVDTAGNVVTAEVDHFSVIGVFGEVSKQPGGEEEKEKPGEDLPRTMGYISYLLLGSLLLAAAGLFLFMRRKGLEGR